MGRGKKKSRWLNTLPLTSRIAVGGEGANHQRCMFVGWWDWALKAETLLWWIRHDDYYVVSARTAAFQRIAGLLGEDYTAEIVKNKLDTLRGQYVRELHKETASKKSGAGADDVYKSRWKFFDQLDFLRGVVTPKKTTSNLDTTNKENEPSTSAESQENGDLPVVSPPTKRARKNEVMSCMNAAVDVIKSLQLQKATTSAPQSKDDDEDVWFGKTVAAKMRKIKNEDVKVEVKYKIEKLLAHAVRQDTSGIFRPF